MMPKTHSWLELPSLDSTALSRVIMACCVQTARRESDSGSSGTHLARAKGRDVRFSNGNQLGGGDVSTAWLVEIASIWSEFGRTVGYSRLGLPLPALNAYWIASRQRADSWHRSLHRYRNQLESVGAYRRLKVWARLRGTIEEVLVSEVLTRVLSAIALELERDCIDDDSSPITESVFKTHLEVRARCLQLMVDGPGLPVADAVRLNRLRFQLEEWTDMFLGNLEDCHGARVHCHRLARMLEWAEEVKERGNSTDVGLAFQLRMLGVRRWLNRFHTAPEANQQLNHAIGQTAMAMLRPEWFDSLGRFKSLATHRMQNIINETDGMVASLLSTSGPTGKHAEAHGILEQYRRKDSRHPFRG